MADLTLLLEILTYKNGGQNKKVECDSRSLAWLVDYSKLGQKKVDVENACEAFCNVCQTKECGGKGTKHCLWLTRFKKAMEE